MDGSGPQRAEGGEHAPARVEQRHRVEPGRAVGHLEAVGREASVVDDAAVVQVGTLGEAGGARGVLDLRGIAGVHIRELQGGIGAGEEVLPVIERQDLPEVLEVGPHLGHRCRHGVPAELWDVEDPGRPGLPQHVGELGRTVGRVDGDHDDPGQARGQLEDHPLRDVRRPDGHPLARGEAAEQRPGGLLAVGQQLGMAPAPPLGWIGDPGHERGAIRGVGRGLAQQATDCCLDDRFALVTGPVGLGARHGQRQ